jgi:hypothetical protein
LDKEVVMEPTLAVAVLALVRLVLPVSLLVLLGSWIEKSSRRTA